ncbi:predicted protein [Scheffersomyces stipitis CBS 6054]|uniref:AB hydrolase-1 domain-containing protein n=1 Tax=Scheffersomyces stipitis (strain ATCC 58785 / CBS 6054 / NBRC 10063 / NRRL Y-11545) TaxID=322104 RepID=A3LNV8_PICST|nr:predicted protein [Scheffersomyces stipitis CBS 6054]ABN64933.2 predicted protein [Scheffersomyces stipitis CBS 6054]KAG2736661.1 hypothetical protein G9P44_000751 [Scheffersomyces stipitis]
MLISRLRCPNRVVVRFFTGAARARKFTVPDDYKETHLNISAIPLSTCLKIWKRSLKPQRLNQLQHELVELMYPSNSEENKDVHREYKQVKIDKEGNHINEVSFSVVHDPSLSTKHVVFVHGYGASLGCFARNFQVINLLKNDKTHNYKVHFLDNLTFGLSSNPKLNNPFINKWWIAQAPKLKLHDSQIPTDPKKLYNKYYKLIDGYEIDVNEFKKYQSHYWPILKDLEHYHTSALDNWRAASGIDKIDYLVGHSYGGYWSASYSVRYPDNLKNLILLSPVGVERHAQAVTNDSVDSVPESIKVVKLKPSVDPTSFKFLTRIPILNSKHNFSWYYWLPFMPRFLKWLGPWGVSQYYKMWLSKLLKINKLIKKKGGASALFKSSNDLVYGTPKEVMLIVEYLYNSISRGSRSDVYIKNLLTPSTVSKWPLYDKFHDFFKNQPKNKFPIHLLYGQFDFMNAEAGEKLAHLINSKSDKETASFYKISEGGHNLYIDNPFETNQVIYEIVTGKNDK